MGKSILVSKTFWVNLISAFIAILEGSEIINLFPAGTDTAKWFAAAVFVLNIVLRYVTTQPVHLPGESKQGY